MTTPAIRFENLSKTYRSGSHEILAVRNLNLEVAPQQVYGFLGHNGAGKTTTIQMMLDLVRPTMGAVHLLGKSVRAEREVLRRVGGLVEGATFYGYLTGRRNLEVQARTQGGIPPSRIDEVLELTRMTERAAEPVRGYSMGMKQRLGLASALLSDPDLVILDEPTNGLDPSGIQDMRSFVQELADVHGKTVFLSSHILNEVEQVCDRVAIIQNGAIVAEGAVAELLAGEPQLRVAASPLEGAASALREKWPTSADGDQLVVDASRDESPAVVRALVAAGIDVFEVRVQRQSLESYFMAVTQEENHDA